MTTLTAATPATGGGIVPSRAPRPAAAPSGGLSGADAVRIIRQRLVLIIVIWAICSALAAGFTWFMIRYYPNYVAFALVRVKSTNPVSVLNPLEQRQILQKEVEMLVQNQALIVKSPHVLGAALKDPEVKATEWYRWAMGEKDEDPVDLLSDILYATPVRDSNFLRVGATWEVPKEVPILVNTVVDNYLEKVNKLQEMSIRESRDQLDREVERKLAKFEGKQRDIEDLRKSAEVWGAIEGGPSEELLTLQALTTELEVESLGREAQWEALMNARPEDLPITAELQAILQMDPTILYLERVWQEAEAGLELARGRYGKNHPVVKNARLARDAAADRVAEERAVKLLRYQQEQIEQARRNWLEAQDQVVKLKERLFGARAEQSDRDAKYARYLRLMEERDLLRMQYEALLEQQNVLNMTLRQKSTVQIDVPSPAVEPKRRASPLWEIWLPAGAVLGLLLSVGIAFLLEVADKSVRTPRDVPRVPVLGTIPTADDDEVEIERVETASIDAPHSVVAEAFRNLRANLFFSAPAEQQGVIMVTSPSGGNGKTTVAANLGISIALSGRRVLLIDANFRRAGLPRIFPDVRDEGLSNILIGQGHLADLAVPTSVPGLDVLGPGPAPPNPAELLGSSYLRDVVVDARSRYDQVILDGPPVLLVSDAMVLAGAVDGVLVVCQYRATSRGAFQRTQTQLEAINTRIFGAVLNRVETRAGGYFRKVYREFYEYHEPEEGAEAGRPQLDAASTEGRLQVTTTETPDQPEGSGGADASDAEPEIPESTGMPEAEESGSAPVVGDAEDSGTEEDRAAGPGEQAGGAPDRDEGKLPDQDAAAFSHPGLDDEIKKIDDDQAFGDALDLDEDFKIDEDFDLGEDVEGPEKPKDEG